MGIMIIYGPRFFIFGPPVLLMPEVNKMHSRKQFKSNEKKEDIRSQNLVGMVFMARRISHMPAKKTSNALQRLPNEL